MEMVGNNFVACCLVDKGEDVLVSVYVIGPHVSEMNL